MVPLRTWVEGQPERTLLGSTTMPAAQAHFNLGVELRDDPDSAINAVRKAIEIDPNYGRAYHTLSRVLRNKNEIVLAAAAMHNAAEIDPRHRYDAGCYAALACCGPGVDVGKLTDEERGKLRKQAVYWLRADLPDWAKRLEADQDEDRRLVAQNLQHWLRGSNLAAVRDAEQLAELSSNERQDCQQLWADVAALLEGANAQSEPLQAP